MTEAAPGEIFVHFNSTRELAKQRTLSGGRRAESGEGRLKAVLYTAIFLILIVVAWKAIPPYVNEYELVDKMQEQARFAVVNRYTEEQIRDNVFKDVQNLEIAANPEIKRSDIKVIATQQVVKISLEYSVPVDFFLYSTELHFTPSSENKSIM
jgi:hypothetical protein